MYYMLYSCLPSRRVLAQANGHPKMATRRPSPRRAAKHVDSHVLVELLAAVLPVACTDGFNKNKVIFEHSTLDMKREINHEHLSNHFGILGVLLDVNDTGIYCQDDMKVAVAALAAKPSLKGVDIEMESYKLRVMLSHLRITKARGVPRLAPKVLDNIKVLISKLAPEATRHKKWG